MTDSTPTKSVAVKFVGSGRAAENAKLAPGNTVADLMKKLKLSTETFQLSNSKTPDTIYEPSSILYAMVQDGDMLHCSARVIAGSSRVLPILADCLAAALCFSAAVIIIALGLIPHHATSSVRPATIYYGGGDIPGPEQERNHGRS